MRQTEFLEKIFFVFGKEFSYHLDTLILSIVVSGLILGLCLWCRKGSGFRPTRRQVFLEALLGWFDEILKESLGSRGRIFLAFTVALFLFVLISNWIGLIPGCLSPTRDINTCLGLALLVFTIAHINAIRTKGIGRYLKSYFKPYWWLFPSNVFSEISKTLSHSFRLFGNIFAGGIVVALIPTIILKLLHYWGIPLIIISNPFLQAFFGIFIGGIQAFVFTMLAVSYIGVLAQG